MFLLLLQFLKYENAAKEEVAAAYAEELFHNPEVWEYVLSEEPSFKDRVIAFFKGANKKYSFEEGMSREAKIQKATEKAETKAERAIETKEAQLKAWIYHRHGILAELG